MNQSLKRGAWIVISAIFAITVFSIINIWSTEIIVEADTPPPILPEFNGFAFSDQLENSKNLNTQPIPVPQEATGWSLVVSETFTTTLISTTWSAIDNDGLTNGEYYWATGVYSNTGTTDAIARAISGGANGISVTVSEGYTNSVDSWLILGPFSTEGANQAVITFDYWFDAAVGDNFGIAVSTDGGSTYSGERMNGGSPGWNSVSYSLNDALGGTAVYVAFIFTTNNDGNILNRLGAYLDNVNLYMRYTINTYLPLMRKDPTPTPTNTPIPTSTPTPTPTTTPQSGNYYDDFNNSNSGWAMRRTDLSSTNDWKIIYTNIGELELTINNKTESYLIASPLVAAPVPPYNIEVEARFTSQTEHRHEYGILFGADWNGNTCPQPSNFSTCFNKYYWLRVQWDESNPGAPFLKYMLRRVDSYNANNEPIFTDLIGFRILHGAIPTGWHEWDILVSANGEIRISFNDVLQVSAVDTTLINQRYFGVSVDTHEISNARVMFDYYKIDGVP